MTAPARFPLLQHPTRLLRTGAVLLVAVGLCLWLTRPGIVGCPRAWVVPHLGPALGGLFSMVLGVPACNGLLAYLVPLVLAMLLVRRIVPVLGTLLVCVLAEGAYRALWLHDAQWAILWPAWKAASSLVLAAPLLALHLWRQRAVGYSQTLL